MRPFPGVVRIEPAGICNLHCTHCPVGVEGGKRRILQLAEFIRYFEMLPAVPRVMVFYHGGEPLLNKDLEWMILYAKQHGVSHTVFNSNVALLTEKRGLSLGLCGLDELRVSFDGDSPEENDTIRVGSHFLQHAPVVARVAQAAIRPGKIVIYNARHGTDEPAPYLKEFFAGCPVAFRGEKMREWARLPKGPAQGGYITGEWVWPDHGGLPYPKPRDVDFCSNLFDTFTILSDGNVVMCCEDLQADDIVGNVNEETPLAIWDRMEERRRGFSLKQYPKLCQSCWVVTQRFMR